MRSHHANSCEFIREHACAYKLKCSTYTWVMLKLELIRSLEYFFKSPGALSLDSISNLVCGQDVKKIKNIQF